MTDRQAVSIRQAVLHQQSLNTGTMVRYPAALRRRVLAYVLGCEQAGESVKKVAARVGLRPQIISYWRQRRPAGAFRPVRLASGRRREAVRTEPARGVLVTPQGARVEGLDVAGLAELLRVLA